MMVLGAEELLGLKYKISIHFKSSRISSYNKGVESENCLASPSVYLEKLTNLSLLFPKNVMVYLVALK